MSHQTDNQTAEKRRLRQRIQRFYQLLNERHRDECFALIDPSLREAGAITFAAYVATPSSFYAAYGPLENVALRDLKLHGNAKSKLYGERDFAHCVVTLQDRDHEQHPLHERWVKADDGRWYTRMVGLA